jgi:hypothetical protein
MDNGNDICHMSSVEEAPSLSLLISDFFMDSEDPRSNLNVEVL